MFFKKKKLNEEKKAALDFAKGLQKKYDQTSSKFKESDEQYLKEFDARVDAQREQVKVALKNKLLRLMMLHKLWKQMINLLN